MKGRGQPSTLLLPSTRAVNGLVGSIVAFVTAVAIAAEGDVTAIGGVPFAAY